MAAHLAQLLGLPPAQLTAGRLTYDLRPLRLHGLIVRVPKTHRYLVTPFGLRLALFVTRVHARLFRPGVARSLPQRRAATTPPCARPSIGSSGR
jgi:hypothetical protein